MNKINKLEIIDCFDADDIRKIRDYNSQRHSQMPHAEVIADIKKGANEVIQKYGLQIQYENLICGKFLLTSLHDYLYKKTEFSFRKSDLLWQMVNTVDVARLEYVKKACLIALEEV